MNTTISLTVNGETREIPAATSLLQLLEILEITGVRVAVACNGQVIPQQQHETTLLQPNDRVEIVRMVGGG